MTGIVLGLSALALVLAALFLVARTAFALPSLEGRQGSAYIPALPETRLGKLILPMMEDHPGLSGVLPLRRGTDAFAARIHLANAAQNSIDAQYYIWADDPSGLILLDALRQAALRGVRVRLLVDDNGTRGLDIILAKLNALPNFEVRIFNPATLRRPRLAAFVFDFRRLNRRMHNKSFTVDGVASIVGGRNIGDIYFAYGEGSLYCDMGVLAVGQIAEDVSVNFDLFWNSLSAYPAELILKRRDTGLEGFSADVAQARSRRDREEYEKAIQAAQVMSDLKDGNRALDWVGVQMLSDDPAKALNAIPEDQLLVRRIISVLGTAEASLDLASAYFIPSQNLIEHFSHLVRAGTRIRTLTNSQEATDVLLVHAHYVDYRRALLEVGVDLFELKSAQARKLIRRMGFMKGSRTSLHAKAFSIDGKRTFIGSFNFDPRSAQLNCEMGFLIESSILAKAMSESFDTRMKLAAYHVVRARNGSLIWIERDEAGALKEYSVEPHTTLFGRTLVRMLGWLPIQWLL